MKAKKQKAKRRSAPIGRIHSSLDGLPASLCETLFRMLRGNEWPADFGKHPGSAPRYVDLVKYCKIKGHIVSHSAIGRFAKRMRSLSSKKSDVAGRAERIKDLVLSGIAVEAAEFCGAVSDLTDCVIHPDDHPEGKTAIPCIRKQANEQLAYIKQAIEDLQQLETAGSLVSGETIKGSSGRPRANTEGISGQKPQTTKMRP